MRPHAVARLTPQHRWWLWLCVASVLAFQTLGLVHRSLHGGAPAVARVAMALAATSDTGAAVGAVDLDKTHAAGSFGHVAGSADCQLLDQLSHSLGPATVQALAWTALLPDGPVATPQPHSAVVARVWRLPARAPPLA